MSDWLIWCALSFLAGGGVGGLIMNEFAWRAQRRELEELRRDQEASNKKWDAEMADLKRGVVG